MFEIDKSKIIAVIALLLGIAGIILSVINNRTIKQDLSELSVSDINIYEFKQQEDNANDGSTDGEQTGNTQSTSLNGTYLFEMQDGYFVSVDSTFTLFLNNDKANGISFDIPNIHNVEYDSERDFMLVDDNIVIKILPPELGSYDGIGNFTNTSGVNVIIAEKPIYDNEQNVIAILAAMCPGDETTNPETMQFINDILLTARKGNNTNIALCGLQLNQQWIEKCTFTQDTISLTKGEASIYITPYMYDTFISEEGINKLNANGITVEYVDGIKDTSTGYVPYLTKIKQIKVSDNNEVNRNGEEKTIKLVAMNNGAINELFTQ